MKRKWLTSLLMLVMLCTLAGGGAVLAFGLDDSKEAAGIRDVNTGNAAGWGDSVLVGMTDDCGKYGFPAPDPAETKAHLESHIEYVDKNMGNLLATAETCGSSVAVNRGNDKSAVGNIITVKAGLEWAGKEIKSDVSYLCNAIGTPWVVYNPTTFTANSATETLLVDANKTISFTAAYEDGNYNDAPVTYASSDTSKVTVSGNGLSATITAVAKTTDPVTITATLYGGKTATVAVTVEEPTAPLTGIEVTGKITVYKGITALTQGDLGGLNGKKIYGSEEDNNKSEAEFDVELSMLSGLPADFNTVGTTSVTVTTEGMSDTVDLEIVERPALNVSNVNFDFAGIMVQFDENSDYNWQTKPGTFTNTHIEIVDSQGNDLSSNYSYQKHENYVWAQQVYNPTPAIGTRITFKQGFVFVNKEIKANTTYIFSAVGSPWVVYNPETHDATSITITTEADDFFFAQTTKQLEWTLSAGAAAYPTFTTSNENVATVDANGLITGVAQGTATITATVGYGENVKTATYEIDVKPALPLDGVALKTSYKIWIEKGEDFFVPSDFSAVPVYKNGENDFFGREFKLVTSGDNANTVVVGTVDTSEVGTKKATLKVSFETVEKDIEVDVEVYEVIPMQIQELAIVEFFEFAAFIEFPNSTMNKANFTSTSDIPDAVKYTYTRADGTPVNCGTYVLGGGNIALLPDFLNIMLFDENGDPVYRLDKDGNPTNVQERVININNFNTDPRFYCEGDKVTIEAGITAYRWTGTLSSDNPVKGTGMIIRECVLENEVTYIFDGANWVEFASTEDFGFGNNVTVGEDSNTATVTLGTPLNLGTKRLPNGATEGKFVYAVEDETVLTVNKSGRITAKKLGSTTITITLTDRAGGDIVKSVVVTVVNGVKELVFNNADGKVTEIEVKKGTANPVAGLSAKVIWQNDDETDADLSEAVFAGYTADNLGKQTVTVTITVDGAKVSGTIIVNVVADEEAGCGCGSDVGGVASLVFAGAVLAFALALVAAKKAKQN